MCTATALRVRIRGPLTFPQKCIGHMSSKNAGMVVLVVLAGLVIGVLGLVESDLYAVGLLILFFGGVGVAVLAGQYLIRYISSRRPPRDGFSG
jgi:hypothetical protein